ncbi:hypothetical protein Lal_00040176 [Lupinus albus]|uniref:Putative transcription factor MADS-type1 family n=1 Tax=Lupinus albus TaxID=3870 RepID=A0A6A5N2F7_LUPAL|nr:putative transcription factor MADS-type1 family [Lupinus albus]KAF1877460.1 hypothetical protein Lal_00040176 [Lupinus albus]
MSNPIPNPVPKKNKGRQKIEMKKITKESNLQVTFSKRRTGLFKKASELCTLCDAKVGLVVFSPANKAFSFGDPSIDAVIDRYQMREQPPLNMGNMQYLEAHRSAHVQDLNNKINRMNEELEIEKKCSEELAKQRKEAQEHFWWAAPIDEMHGEQLDQFKFALENLKKNVLAVVERQKIAEAAEAAIPPPNFFIGGPSSSNNPLQPPPLPPTQEFPLQLPPPQQFMQPLPQQFPVYPPPPPPPPPSHMLQNQTLMLPNNMFNGTMMNQLSFNNNMGGYGPAGGFF